MRLVCFISAFIVFISPCIGQAAELQNRKSVALILSGGGAKGYALLPVLELIDELEIPVDMVVGVSAGAIAGGLYSAGYTPEMIKEKLLNLNWPEIFADKPPYPYKNELQIEDVSLNISLENTNSGFSTGETAYKLFKTFTAKIPSYTGFDKLPIPFRAAAVNMNNAKLELLETGDIAEAIRASMSLPLIFDAFTIDGARYTDGGIRDNLPINRVKDMGYDIIIAVDLFSDIDTLNASSIDIIKDLFSLYFSSKSSAQYKNADLIICPDIEQFSILDFTKSNEIYAKAESEKEKMRSQLLAVKQKIYGTGFNNRAKTGAHNNYAERPAITPQRLIVNGALHGDKTFIEKQFARIIADKSLDEDNLNAFITSVYNTGNYSSVITRIDTRSGIPVFELLLTPVNIKQTAIRITGSYDSTFISDAFGLLSLKADLFSFGLFGYGSVLCAGTEINNQLSTHLTFFQPLKYNLYLLANTVYIHETNVITTLFGSGNNNKPIGWDTEFKLGIQSVKKTTFDSGVRFVYLNSEAVLSEGAAVSEKNNIAFAGFAGITFNSLNSYILPSKGSYVHIVNSLYFPAPNNTQNTFDLISTSLCTAFPLQNQFSLVFRGFAGLELTHTLHENPILERYFSWNTYDRTFFPQTSSNIEYGTIKGAGMITFQYCLKESLTIFGGQSFFSVSAGAGTVLKAMTDRPLERTLWNISLNGAVKFSNTFAAKLRIGAGKLSGGDVSPFIAIDIGSSN
ncbi:MAG: patatin-like phospholipase family protein [Spirochaetaceae bacterium]|jgi:NTE family protein|nr:patatin-like phospholipase family protein [Spirochaetaceae bacterium]